MTITETYAASLGLFRDALCHLLRMLIALATIVVLHVALLTEYAVKILAAGTRITAPAHREGI